MNERNYRLLIFTALSAYVIAWALVLVLLMDRHHQHACTHGESSITATRINGKYVATKPHTTGCTP